jgi:hypothetical protein
VRRIPLFDRVFVNPSRAAQSGLRNLQIFAGPLHDNEGLPDRALPPKSHQTGNIQRKFVRGDL